MKLIESSVEIIPQESGLEGIYKQCELAGRTAYKSEDRITEGSAKKFVGAMMKSNHGAVLEHGTVYLMAKTEMVNWYIHPEDGYEEEYNVLEKYKFNPYSKYGDDGEYVYVTTNLRVLFENGWMDDLKYWCEPTEFHERRVTAKFICSRGVSHEAVRHRTIKLLVA